jgi:hypothetical protein
MKIDKSEHSAKRHPLGMLLQPLLPVFILTCSLGDASSALAQFNSGNLRAWGYETAQQIESTLLKPGTQLYAESAALNGSQFGGFNGSAYVWPVSTQFRVLNTLTQIEPSIYNRKLQQFSDQVHSAYWNNGYRSGAGGGDRFYDDNAHMVVALVEAYRITNDSTYLSRALNTHAFVLQGEDSVAGGGIYFKQFDFSSKDAISTLQAARGAAMLYNVTGVSSYLNDATRLLTWARNRIQRSDGMFSERWNISQNRAEGFDLINSAGIGISTNLELYDATNNPAYLSEAQRMANRTLTRYFDSGTGRINDEGYWAFELVDALDNLYLHDRNPLWINRVNGGLTWLHDNKRDPLGHYGLFWGRNGPQVGTLNSWNLNEQASVARAYLYTSTIPEPSLAFIVSSAAVGLLLTLASRRFRKKQNPPALQARHVIEFRSQA